MSAMRRRPQICPICGEPGDGVTWCEKCEETIRKAVANTLDRLRNLKKSNTPIAEIIELAAKRGRNFERLRNRKRRYAKLVRI